MHALVRSFIRGCRLIAFGCIACLFGTAMRGAIFTVSGYIQTWDVYDDDGNWSLGATTDFYSIDIGGNGYVSVSCNLNANAYSEDIPMYGNSSFAVGTCELTVTAMYDYGGGYTANVYAQYAAAPVAALSVSPAAGSSPLEVNFDAAGSTSSSEHDWDLGNGVQQSTSGTTISTTYQNASSTDPAYYTATVYVVVGDRWNKASDDITVYPYDSHRLTVINGTSNPSYPYVHSATITANPAPSGYAFAHWDVTPSSGYTIANPSASSTTITLSADETVTAVYLPVSPVITTQPSSVAVSAGQTAMFSVIASSPYALRYEWRKNGTPITNATSATYTLPDPQSGDAANYDVVVTSSAGSTTSRQATLTVNAAAPAFTAPPAAGVVYPGDSIQLQAMAYGTEPFTYQWYKDGQPIAGATTASYTRANAQISDSGTFALQISNSVGTTMSPPALVTVSEAVRLALQYWQGNDGPLPDNDEGQFGSGWNTTQGELWIAQSGADYNASRPDRGSVLLNYTTGDDITFRAHGYAIASNCSSFLVSVYNPSGGTVATGTFTNGNYWQNTFNAATSGLYRVDVSYANATGTSIPANGTVSYYFPVGNQRPVVKQQPSDIFAGLGTTAVLSASIAGSPTLAFQWSKNGVNIPGGTRAVLNVANVQASSAGAYSLAASNSFGSITTSSATLTIATQPVLSPLPSNATVNAGSGTVLSVNATGNALTYKWLKNGVPLLGATASSFPIANALQADAASYSVVVSNPAGAVTSNSLTLTVTAVAPNFTLQPSSVTKMLGESLTWSVAATGTVPITYQWCKNGTSISGATGTSYSISGLQASDGAAYTVVATNAVGSTTSSAATLTIDPTQSVRLALQYWHVNDYPDRWSGGYYQSQDVWIPDYTDDGGNLVPGHYETQYVWIDTYDADGFYGSTWTTSAGTFGDPNTDGRGAYGVAPNNRGDLLGNYAGGTLTFRAWGAAPWGNCNSFSLAAYSGGVSGSTFVYGSSAIASGTCDSGSYVQAQISVPISRIDFSYSGATGGVPASGTVSYYVLPNLTPMPQIFAQPKSKIDATVNTSVTISIAAGSTVLPSIQWLRNGAPIPGATNSDYTIGSAQFTDGGGTVGTSASYTALVTNANGSVTSTPCVLTVWNPGVPPSISSYCQPQNTTVMAGTFAVLTPLVSGGQPMSYQWYKNGTAVAGATSMWLWIPTATYADAGSYALLSTNAAGPLWSASATLTVTNPPPAPVISAQPASCSADLNSTVSFTVTATTTDGYLFYGWEKDGVSIPGQSQATLTISGVQASDAGSYRARVNNTGAVVYTAWATLTVNGPPVISVQPASTSASVGGVASFSVTIGSGTTPYSYQWKKGSGGTAISGATNASLTLSSVTSSDADSYFVEVSNAAGTVTSNAATLTVTSSPPVISLQPSNTTARLNGTAQFSVSLSSGSTPISYQWKKDGTAISGATASTLALTNVQAGDAGNYTVDVTNPVTTVTSNAAALTVVAVPSGAPLAFDAKDRTPYSFLANWSPVPAATEFRLDVATDSAFTSIVLSNFRVAATLSNGTSLPLTAYTVSNLNPSTQYYYRVRAVTNAGTSENSNTQTVQTLPQVTTAGLSSGSWLEVPVSWTHANGTWTPNYSGLRDEIIFSGNTFNYYISSWYYYNPNLGVTFDQDWPVNDWWDPVIVDLRDASGNLITSNSSWLDGFTYYDDPQWYTFYVSTEFGTEPGDTYDIAYSKATTLNSQDLTIVSGGHDLSFPEGGWQTVPLYAAPFNKSDLDGVSFYLIHRSRPIGSVSLPLSDGATLRPSLNGTSAGLALSGNLSASFTTGGCTIVPSISGWGGPSISTGSGGTACTWPGTGSVTGTATVSMGTGGITIGLPSSVGGGSVTVSPTGAISVSGIPGASGPPTLGHPITVGGTTISVDAQGTTTIAFPDGTVIGGSAAGGSIIFSNGTGISIGKDGTVGGRLVLPDGTVISADTAGNMGIVLPSGLGMGVGPGGKIALSLPSGTIPPLVAQVLNTAQQLLHGEVIWVIREILGTGGYGPIITQPASYGSPDIGALSAGGRYQVGMRYGPGENQILWFEPTPQIRLLVDVNRDGTIADGETGAFDKPYRFWINDDNDSGDEKTDDYQDVSSDNPAVRNCDRFSVNGIRDLIDFFPVFLNLKDTLAAYPPEQGYKYRLTQEDSAVKIVYTGLTQAEALQYQTEDKGSIFGDHLNSPIASAGVELVTSTGFVGGSSLFQLSPEFLNAIRTHNGGVLLIEGCAATTNPLVLRVEKSDGTLVKDAELWLRIDRVQTMFHYYNIRPLANAAPMTADDTGAASSYALPSQPLNDPFQGLPNRKNIVFLHGYNVGGKEATGTIPEMFKRMYWAGSKANFYGVEWRGNDHTILDYQLQVGHAWQQAQHVRNLLNGLTGDTVMIAHSLGNMVTLVALNYDRDSSNSARIVPASRPASVKNYFAIDAAVPLEALAATDRTSATKANMVHPSWIGYEERLWPTEWHSLFPSSDARSAFTWLDRFATLDIGTNFYSSGDEVLDNPVDSSVPSAVDMLTNPFTHHAWVAHEKTKGGYAVTPTQFAIVNPEGVWLRSTHNSGWGDNVNWWIYDSSINGLRRRTTAEANAYDVPTSSLPSTPFFQQFQWTEDGTYYPGYQGQRLMALIGDVNADDEARKLVTVAKVLGEGIPSLSYAQGRNSSTRHDRLGLGGNFNLNTDTFKKEWPTSLSHGDWRHGDYIKIAYRYTYPLFEKIATDGGLK